MTIFYRKSVKRLPELFEVSEQGEFYLRYSTNLNHSRVKVVPMQDMGLGGVVFCRKQGPCHEAYAARSAHPKGKKGRFLEKIQ